MSIFRIKSRLKYKNKHCRTHHTVKQVTHFVKTICN